MTGGARREGNFGEKGGGGGGWAAWAQRGRGRARLSRPGRPMAGEGRGKGGAAGPPSWAGAKGEGAAGPKGEKGGERKRKGFPFFISIFLYECFHTFKQPKNAWFGMMQQIKEINSRVYYYHIT
jgi:hypothetical protein